MQQGTIVVTIGGKFYERTRIDTFLNKLRDTVNLTPLQWQEKLQSQIPEVQAAIKKREVPLTNHERVFAKNGETGKIEEGDQDGWALERRLLRLKAILQSVDFEPLEGEDPLLILKQDLRDELREFNLGVIETNQIFDALAFLAIDPKGHYAPNIAGNPVIEIYYQVLFDGKVPTDEFVKDNPFPYIPLFNDPPTIPKPVRSYAKKTNFLPFKTRPKILPPDLVDFKHMLFTDCLFAIDNQGKLSSPVALLNYPGADFEKELAKEGIAFDVFEMDSATYRKAAYAKQAAEVTLENALLGVSPGTKLHAFATGELIFEYAKGNRIGFRLATAKRDETIAKFAQQIGDKQVQVLRYENFANSVWADEM